MLVSTFPLKTTIGKKEKELEKPPACIPALVFPIKNEGLLPHTDP